MNAETKKTVVSKCFRRSKVLFQNTLSFWVSKVDLILFLVSMIGVLLAKFLKQEILPWIGYEKNQRNQKSFSILLETSSSYFSVGVLSEFCWEKDCKNGLCWIIRTIDFNSEPFVTVIKILVFLVTVTHHIPHVKKICFQKESISHWPSSKWGFDLTVSFRDIRSH